MRATWHQLRTQARGSSAHVEAKMDQIGPPSATQGKHVEYWLQTSIGKSRSWRFAAEWWTSVLKTSNAQMVNSRNRQTPAAKHLLLLAFGAQAMWSAISKVCRNVQQLPFLQSFLYFYMIFIKSEKLQIASGHTKNSPTTKQAKSWGVRFRS